MPSTNDLLALAKAAANQAAEYLRSIPHPKDPEVWVAKGRRDWVTAADRASEEIIREVLQSGEPGTKVLGEELSPDTDTSGLVWVVDPLDGTANFVHAFPAYAVSIAAAVDGVLEAGVVLHIPLNRTTHATRGGGAWENGGRLEVSSIAEPRHALIGTGFPWRDFSGLDRYVAQLSRVVQEATGVRRPGSAAIDLADVAAGRFDGFWEHRLAPWDIAAGTLLIREAGGRVTDFTGRDLGVEHTEVLAGNPAIHRWMLGILSGG